MTGLPDWAEGRVSFTVREVMKLTGVPRTTIDKMIRERVLVAEQPLGARTKLYITVDSFERAFGVPTGDTAGTQEGTEGEG